MRKLCLDVEGIRVESFTADPDAFAGGGTVPAFAGTGNDPQVTCGASCAPSCETCAGQTCGSACQGTCASGGDVCCA